MTIPISKQQILSNIVNDLKTIDNLAAIVSVVRIA